MIEANIPGLFKVIDKIKKIEKDSEKVTRKTLNDFKSRGAGWVASAVTDIYNIKKSEINAAARNQKPAGTIRIQGHTVDNISIVFYGRVLTPVHFGMTPKIPPARRNYTLKQTVFKGKTEVIGRYNKKKVKGGPYSERSHNILMPTGAKAVGKVPFIPFQRIGKRTSGIHSFKTTSIPQMIGNPDVQIKINENIEKGLMPRFENHMKQALKNK